MDEPTKREITRLLQSKRTRASYIRMFAFVAALLALVVTMGLRQNGVAATHEEQVLDCQYAGTAAHTHNAYCYDKDGNLVCKLPERELHSHTDECYTETRELACGLEESDGHHHTDACYDEEGNLICGEAESEGHHHTDACYKVTRELTCGLDEVTETHTHGPGCFKTIEVPDATNDTTVTDDATADDTKDADEKPAQEFSGSLKKIKENGEEQVVLVVAVKAPKGAFPAGTTMKVDGVDPNKIEDVITKAVQKADKDATILNWFMGVDIKFFDPQGFEIQPEKKVEIKITHNRIRDIEEPILARTLDAEAKAKYNKKDDAEVLDQVILANQVDDDKSTGNENTFKFKTKLATTYVLVESQYKEEHVPAPVVTEAQVEAMPPQNFSETFTSEGTAGDVTVTVEAPSGSLPEGAILKIDEIAEGTDAYTNYLAQAAETAEGKDVALASFLDLTFVKDGKEIQPMKPVKVEITLENAPTEEAAAAVLHMGNKAQSVSADQNAGTVTFEAERFSVYGVIYTVEDDAEVDSELSELHFKGDGYAVTISYGIEAGIPEGSKLQASEYDSDSSEYRDAFEAVSASDKDAEDDPDTLAFRAFDISIIGADGKELEPTGSVDTRIELDSIGDDVDASLLGETVNVDVQHLTELEKGVTPELVASLDFGVDVDADEGSLTAEFSTDHFSTFTIRFRQNNSTRANVTAHYVDQNGNEIQGPQTQQVDISQGTLDLNNAYARTIPGYTFKESRYQSYTGDRIRYLEVRDGYLYFENEEQRDHISGGYNRNRNVYSVDRTDSSDRDIYFVYLKDGESTTLTPGTGQIQTDTTNPLGAPPHEKTLTENTVDGKWDGTYTLSLDVKGNADSGTDKTKADVLIVYDISGSMKDNYVSGTSQTRAQVAEAAMRSMLTKLYSYNEAGEQEPTVRVALQTFSTVSRADKRFGFQNTYDDFDTEFKKIVRANNNGNGYGGGTNWEDGLQDAITFYNANKSEDRDFYVIFVSDGDPTCRKTEGTYYLNWNNEGNNGHINTEASGERYVSTGYTTEDPERHVDRSYQHARDEARALVAAGAHFYSIGIFAENMYRIDNLANYAYTAFDENGSKVTEYSAYARQAGDLDDIFGNIISDITKNFGYKDVKIDDTLSVATKTSLAIDGHANDFTYYKDGQPWTGAPAANYTDGQVHWDLSSIGTLEKDVTYTVKFTVWPNQDAYDAIKMLNAGEKTLEQIEAMYPSLRGLLEGGDGGYTVKSNGDAFVWYKKVTTVNGVETVGEEEYATYPSPAMETLGYTMNVAKVWEDSLFNKNRFKSATFQVKQDGVDYGDPIVLSEENDWQMAIGIVPGIISNRVNGTTPLNNGHVYSIVETSYTDNKGVSHDFSENFNYEFDPEAVTPMLTDGVMVYQGDANGDAKLTGTNSLRSGMNIRKFVVDDSGNNITSDETTFYVKLIAKDAEGHELVLPPNPSQEERDAFPIWYNEFAKWGEDSDGIYGMNEAGVRDWWEKDDVWSSGEVKEIKVGQLLRLKNLPTGTYVELHEMKKVGENSYVDVAQGDDVDGYKLLRIDGDATVTSVVPNNQYGTVFVNQLASRDLRIRKADEQSRDEEDPRKVVTLSGAKFELSKVGAGKLYFGSDGSVLTEEAVAAIIEGFADMSDAQKAAALEENDISTFFEVDGEATLHGITTGSYVLTEIEAPAGYVMLTSSVNFTVGSEITGDEGVLIEQKSQTDAARITVYNEAGAELPHSGGVGTQLILAIGAGMIAAGALVLFNRRRGLIAL